MEQHDIQSTLAHLQGADQKAIGLLASLFRPISLEKGQLLCAPGQNGRSLYLLSKGILHHYRKDRSHGKTNSIQILLPGYYLGNPATLVAPSPNDYIAAISPCELLAATQMELQLLCRNYPQAAELIYAIQQQISLRQLDLIEMHHLQPASLRQRSMSERLGIHIYQIPLQILASYLSISRKHLGRLKASQLRSIK